MQGNNSEKIKNILLSLAEHKKVKGIRGLARYLEQDENKLYGWIKRGKIGDTRCILAKMGYINLEWLMSGKQPMMIIDENNFGQLTKEKIPSRKIAARIDPGKTIHEGFVVNEDEENLSLPDLAKMAIEVLESRGIFSVALKSNIRAFHQAIRGEEEMNELRKEVMEMKAMLQALMDRSGIDIDQETTTLSDKKRDKMSNG